MTSAPVPAPEKEGNLLILAALSLVVGAAAGLVGAMFRLTLQQADHLRNLLIDWAHGHAIIGFLVLIATCGVATSIAAWLVRRFSPPASGSGIPHVEAVLHGQLETAPYRLAPVKYAGGVLAIGSGLALGREGPSVQMGASIAVFIGHMFRRCWPDCRVLLAAGAGAGLATAFNAPIAGAVFVLEELVQRFEHRIAIAALGASATAIMIARPFLGVSPDFDVPLVDYADFEVQPLFYLLGAIAGLVAIVYNWALVKALVANRRLPLPVELRAGIVGAAIGALAWFAPAMVGGGDSITERTISGGDPLTAVAFAFALRFALGPISYSVDTPGGLFAPMLVLGTQIGVLFAAACRFLFPTLVIEPTGFAIVGMGAFFTGVVRAPLTGIVLVTEMTSNVTMLLPMLGACFAAMLVPQLLNAPPIYDSLRELTLERERELQQACKTSTPEEKS